MTPHQLAYGVYGVPLNVVIAGVALIAYVASGEIARFRFDPIIFCIIALAGWIGVSQFFSLDPENSAPYTDRFLKTLLFVLVCAQMATSKLRITALVWTLVAGIGFFAAKGAIFTVMTLGEFRVQGLPDTVLADNNHFAIATATVLPFMLYLRSQVEKSWLRHALLVLFILSIFAIIGTHSRGGLIALAVFGGLFWLRSRYKVVLAAGLAAVMVPAIVFMPSKWTERMSTITAAAEDASFMGRVDAWIISSKLAVAHPVTGAGLRNSYQYDVAATVDRVRSERARAAHSIYFEMMGGTGFVGLIIYLGLLGGAFIAAWRVFARRREPDMEPWKVELARAIQMSLIVFGIGGASVSMEMWDGYLVVVACASALSLVAARKAQGPRYALGNPGQIEGSARPRTAAAVPRA
jgi:probable O-glycosylation ligase (exosortase A-associated)